MDLDSQLCSLIVFLSDKNKTKQKNLSPVLLPVDPSHVVENLFHALGWNPDDILFVIVK